jgi:hypothetical protein
MSPLETIRTGASVTNTMWDWLFGVKDEEGNQTWHIDGEQVMDSLKDASISYFSGVPAGKQFDEGWADLYDVRNRFQTFTDNLSTEVTAITDPKYIALTQSIRDPDIGTVTQINTLSLYELKTDLSVDVLTITDPKYIELTQSVTDPDTGTVTQINTVSFYELETDLSVDVLTITDPKYIRLYQTVNEEQILTLSLYQLHSDLNADVMSITSPVYIPLKTTITNPYQTTTVVDTLSLYELKTDAERLKNKNIFEYDKQHPRYTIYFMYLIYIMYLLIVLKF